MILHKISKYDTIWPQNTPPYFTVYISKPMVNRPRLM